jgi:hypothetical protein
LGTLEARLEAQKRCSKERPLLRLGQAIEGIGEISYRVSSAYINE